MPRFYGNWGYSTFNGAGYVCHIQSLIFDENGNPIDVNWDDTQAKYMHHISQPMPYLNDPNAFYGDANSCNGWDEATGIYNYCEYSR